MKKAEVNRFNKLYKEHQRALKLQGKAKKNITDILTPAEIEKMISATRKLRYRVFLLTTYSILPSLANCFSSFLCHKQNPF